jgi:2-polyprenyl-3-methyl-5-hydroxy-6-metoxy-1,4-benzoquinol methylase
VHESFLPLLRCPACSGQLAVADASVRNGDDVIEGTLRCVGCGARHPIESRVPRFVERSNYTDSFGWQWNRFHKLQRDSYNGTNIVRNTNLARTGWTPEWLAGKTLLECGCGSGNDTEILAQFAGRVVSVDMSSSVESQRPDILARDNVLVMRADLREIPVRLGAFDVVYCHRVIHHTPDPREAFAAMARHLRPGGVFFLHSYDRHWKSRLQYKYWLRPFLRGLDHRTVYRLLTVVGPVLYRVAGFGRRVAFLRKPVRLLVPFENHDRTLRKNGATLTRRERYEYSLLITFDALTATYDHPNHPNTLVRWLEQEGFEAIQIRGRNPALVVGRKKA